MKLKLRPFQSAAVGKCIRHLDAGKSVCLVSPTGSGKTVMAQAIAAHYRQRMLCIVHTHALLRQATQRLGPTRTVQQLRRSGLGGTTPRLVIWDECHHSAADDWSRAVELFPKAQRLGLTATPQRSDGKALGLFDEMVVAAHYSALILLGCLVPCRVLIPDAFVDDSDPDPVSAYRTYADGTRALFFVDDCPRADDVAARLGDGFAAYHYAVPSGVREARMRGFKAGRLRGLVTVDALVEGLDVPEVETIVLGRTCHHVAVYLQIVGRGLRVAPGKTHLTLLDLRGASLRHGSPTADRAYTLDGIGISSPSAISHESSPSEARERGWHDARLLEVTDWSRATERERRKTEARLKSLAKERGFDDRVVAEAAKRLFG